MPVANALRRPNRQVRPAPHGLALTWAIAKEKLGKQRSAFPERRHFALSAPCGDTSPKGGGETRLSANFWLCTNLAPPLGELARR